MNGNQNRSGNFPRTFPCRFDGIPHPAVYVIDKNGRVTWAKVESDYRVRPSNEDIRAALALLH